MTKTLVSYFSASGVTKSVAQNLSKALDADIYEIRPKIPYESGDLNWMDKNSRTTIEMRNTNSRPEIADKDAHIENYDTIFLGFPIWWYIAPTIINTFLESYDFSNKKVILFATSGGSGFGNTIRNLKLSVDPSCEMIEGKILNTDNSVEMLKKWSEGLIYDIQTS